MFVVTLLSLTLAGCALDMTRDPGADPEITCGDRNVTVFQTRGSLSVYPEYIDVCRGQSITISAIPRVDGADVRTAPAERGNPEGDGWLGREGRADGSVLIEIPGDAPLGVYKYSITVDGVGTLDPRARVVR
jgi:hypothetical protein